MRIQMRLMKEKVVKLKEKYDILPELVYSVSHDDKGKFKGINFSTYATSHLGEEFIGLPLASGVLTDEFTPFPKGYQIFLSKKRVKRLIEDLQKTLDENTKSK